MLQSPSSIFMVRPDQFGYNTETAKSNAFQKKRLICENHNCRKEALAEFESFVELLRKHQIEVLVFNS
ncbi:MAG: amidinotransferase, partial [Cyclobacteriaceae bacterium]|nr:amidinotransferase [Cyclobacteriaceae bacterium]